MDPLLLEEELGSADEAAVLAALKQASEARRSDLLPIVVNRLAADPGPNLRAALVKTIGYLAGPGDGRLVAHFSEDPEMPVRLETLKALARMRVPGAFPILVRAAVADSSDLVRLAALKILATVSSEVAADHLTRMLDSTYEWVRRAAVRYAGTMMGAEGASILTKGLESRDEWVRQMARDRLAELSAPPEREPAVAASIEPVAPAAVEPVAPTELPAPAATPERPPPGALGEGRPKPRTISWDNFLGDPHASFSKPPPAAGEPEMDVPTGAMHVIPGELRVVLTPALHPPGPISRTTAPPAGMAAPAMPREPSDPVAPAGMAAPAMPRVPSEPAGTSVPVTAADAKGVATAADAAGASEAIRRPRPSKRSVRAAAAGRRCGVCGEDFDQRLLQCPKCGEVAARPSRPSMAAAKKPAPGRPASVTILTLLSLFLGYQTLNLSLPLVSDGAAVGFAVVALGILRFVAAVDLFRGKEWARFALVAVQLNELRTFNAINVPICLVLLAVLHLPSVRAYCEGGAGS